MKVGIYSSQPQSGKSTVSECFEKRGFMKQSFATPVKESLTIVLRHLGAAQYDRYLYGDWKNKIIPELGVTGGYLMSHYATTFFRDMIYEDIWLDCAIDKMAVPGVNYVVDDLRFPNEFDIFDVTIKVVRPQQKNVEHDRSENSEGLLDNKNFTYTIFNDSNNLEDLQKSSYDLINQIWEKNDI